MMVDDSDFYTPIYNPLKLRESAKCLECNWYINRDYSKRGVVFKLAKKHSKETGHKVSFTELRGQTIQVK